jgi:hypothetical protein
MTAAAIAAAVAACESASAPGDGSPRLSRATVSVADPPPDGEAYVSDVSRTAGGIQADVLLRGRLDCTRVGAGLEVEETTFVLTIQTTPQGACPTGGGILLRSTMVGLEPGPADLVIVRWHDVVPAQIDTVFDGVVGE